MKSEILLSSELFTFAMSLTSIVLKKYDKSPIATIIRSAADSMHLKDPFRNEDNLV